MLISDPYSQIYIFLIFNNTFIVGEYQQQFL